jgi:hypothetical protein
MLEEGQIWIDWGIQIDFNKYNKLINDGTDKDD